MDEYTCIPISGKCEFGEGVSISVLLKISKSTELKSLKNFLLKLYTGFVRSPLARDITLTLCIKVLALFVMSYLFFGAAHRLTVSTEIVEQHLLSD